MDKIKDIKARQVFDSRGNPTVECEIKTNSGIFRGIVPSGASTGKHEALELRDNKKEYLGKGVTKAVNNVNKIIAKEIIGKNIDQEKIDNLMINLDGTENKKKLGANAILSVSIALCKAGAAAKNQPLYIYINEIYNKKNKTKIKPSMPIPFLNIINGGKHAGNNINIQEFMIVPYKARTFQQVMRISTEVYHTLKQVIKEKYGIPSINVGDEGGFAPKLNDNEEPLKLIIESINKLNYQDKVGIAIDAAASEFFINNTYKLEKRKFSSEELMNYYFSLIKKYPLLSIEDPFSEDDWKSFSKITIRINKFKRKIQIVGDDLLVTNPMRIKKAIESNSCNTLLLKINQIGTITEALEAARIATENKMNVMVSHRSGETEDDFIADLSVGLGCGEIKSGAPCRGERIVKYNKLLRIEEESKLRLKNPFL